MSGGSCGSRRGPRAPGPSCASQETLRVGGNLCIKAVGCPGTQGDNGFAAGQEPARETHDMTSPSFTFKSKEASFYDADCPKGGLLGIELYTGRSHTVSS